MRDAGCLNDLRLCIVSGLSAMLPTLPLMGCTEEQAPTVDESAEVVAPDQAVPPQSPAITSLAPLGRAELLSAFAAAADRAAGGNPLPEANLKLTSRTFKLRLPFGCAPGKSADWAQWSIDPDTSVLRISVRAQVWTNDPTIKALAAGGSYDAAEGFWIERPWTRSEQCPPPIPPAQNTFGRGPSPSSPGSPLPDPRLSPSKESPVPMLALVQYHSPDAPRNRRRGARPYSYTGKVAATDSIGRQGFHLMLTGRVQGFDDGQPVHCLATDPSAPPVCAISVEITQVAVEDVGTGNTLAEWES